MDKNEVRSIFADLKITKVGNKWKFDGNEVKRDVVVSLISNRLPDDVKPSDAIDLFLAPADGKKAPMLPSTQKFVEIRHGKFFENYWSKVDEEFFSRVYYSVNDTDKSAMMLIKSDENVFQPFVRGSTKEDNLVGITSVCDSVKMESGETYLEWLQAKWRKLEQDTNTNLLDIFSGPYSADEKLEMAANWLCDNVPNSILYRKNNLVAMCKTIVTDEDSYSSPQSFHFLNETGDTFNIISHIITIGDFIVQQPRKRIEMPLSYSSQKGVNCFNYLDLDSIKTVGETPNWDMFLKRFTTDEASVLKAYIWSIFDSRNTGRQALYLYDNGFSGKSAMINAISTVLGKNLHFSLQKGSMSNQFGAAKIWDKRLVTIDDNKNPNILRTEFLHMSTGGGMADVEMKGKNSFSAKFRLKYIIAGNILPEIDTTATHETSRVILLKLRMTDEIYKNIALTDVNGNIVRDRNGKPKLKGDPNFEANLINEFPNFLTKCEEDYNRLCPSHMHIILPESVEDEILNLDSQEVIQYNEMINDHINFDRNGYIKRMDLQRMYDLHAKDYNMEQGIKGYKDFLNHLLKIPGVSNARITVDNSRVNVVKGIKTKSFVSPQLVGIIKPDFDDVSDEKSDINFDD